jgi:hypothetical protein
MIDLELGFSAATIAPPDSLQDKAAGRRLDMSMVAANSAGPKPWKQSRTMFS